MSRGRSYRTSLLAITIGTLVIALTARRKRGRNSWTEWRPPSGIEHDATLHARVIGAGPVIVLLHGLTSSHSSWGGQFDDLSTEHTLVACDLLGFGHSPRPSSGYTANDHSDAVVGCLHDLGIATPALFVGHSLGALVALRIAARHPSLVTGVVAIAPPIYRTPDDARRHIRKLGFIAGLFALDTPLAQRACALMCRHRALATLAVQIASPGIPKVIAESTAQHSWASYSETLHHVLTNGHSAQDLQRASVPIRILAGTNDPVIDVMYLTELAAMLPEVSVELINHAGHELPRSHASVCIGITTAFAHDSE